MRYFYVIFAFICLVLVSILGFRGQKFSHTPLYIFPDMDWQAKYKAQGENKFFNDNRDDRPEIPGIVLRGFGSDMKGVFSEEYKYAPAENPPMYSGKDSDGKYITEFPIPLDHKFLELGRHKFDIFCSRCHGESGDGNGITKSYGMAATASYHDDRLRKMSIGEIFNTVSHGKGQMMAYNYKLSPEERWAVIAYVRALQLSQNASIDDVPSEFRKQLGQ